MNRLLSRAAAAAAIVLFAGCASSPPRAKLTYQTSPEGATLFEGGQPIGLAPVMRTYTADAGGGQIRTPDVTAVWPSGAKATFFTFLKVGDDNITTITRPANAPNLQADLDNARKFQNEADRLKEQQRRAQARASARCQAQQQGGVVAGVDDCN
jgi:hypothetical protein